MAEDSGKHNIDMAERVRTWRLFVVLLKWLAVGLVVLGLILLVLCMGG